MYDAVMIVDQYERYYDSLKNNYKVDVVQEAQGLSMLLNPLGRFNRRVAIVGEEDVAGHEAYNRAGFETILMNGNRQKKLLDFIQEERARLSQELPERLILVSSDPRFVFLCDDLAERRVRVALWPPTGNTPHQLAPYYFRPLEEMVMGTKIQVAQVDVRLDYENLHLALKEQGREPGPKELIDAVKAAVADLGNITTIVAYADWDLIARGNRHNFQRELAIIGVKTRYQVSMRGKNSADMELAGEVHSLLESADAIDTIVIGSHDRDFRRVLEDVKRKGKKAVVLALRQGPGWELRQVADEIRYLDEHLRPDVALRTSQWAGATSVQPEDEDALVVINVAKWLRKRHWKWFYGDRLAELVAESRLRPEELARIRERGLLEPWPERSGALALNPDQPLVRAAQLLVRWLPGRIHYCLSERGMPYVDSNFLARGMAGDRRFQELGLAQSRDEAERWLSLAAEAGLVERRQQSHPVSPAKLITTWWLSGQAAEDKRDS